MNVVRLVATDQQGSVLFDSADTKRAYTAYGLAAIQGGPISAFCGEPRDTLTGLYHLGDGHRQFNPAIMRFHGVDTLSPFGQGGLNAYMYCGADPVNRVDPSGKMGITIAQRVLTITLHTLTPVALIVSPMPEGALAVNATRVGFLGSGASVAGAGLAFAGVAAAPYVSAAGTSLLVAGAGTRMFKALWDNKSAIWRGVKKNASSNLRRIFTGRVEKKSRNIPQGLSPNFARSSGGSTGVAVIENELSNTGNASSSPSLPDITSLPMQEIANIREGQGGRPSL